MATNPRVSVFRALRARRNACLLSGCAVLWLACGQARHSTESGELDATGGAGAVPGTGGTSQVPPTPGTGPGIILAGSTGTGGFAVGPSSDCVWTEIEIPGDRAGGGRCTLGFEGSVAMERAPLGRVTLDGEELALGDANGWRWVAPSRIELLGDACARLTDRSRHSVTIAFPC